MTVANPAPQKRSWLKWLAIGCAVLFVLIGCIVASVFFIAKKATAPAEAAVHEFLAAAGGGDYAKAYSYFSAPLKEKQSLEQFQAAVQGQPSMFKVKDTTFSSRSVDLNGAELKGNVTLESGTDVPCTFKLVRENDAWKLIAYQIGESAQ